MKLTTAYFGVFRIERKVMPFFIEKIMHVLPYSTFHSKTASFIYGKMWLETLRYIGEIPGLLVRVSMLSLIDAMWFWVPPRRVV